MAYVIKSTSLATYTLEKIMPAWFSRLVTGITINRSVESQTLDISASSKDMLIKIIQGDLSYWHDIYSIFEEKTISTEYAFQLLTPLFNLALSYHVINSYLAFYLRDSAISSRVDQDEFNALSNTLELMVYNNAIDLLRNLRRLYDAAQVDTAVNENYQLSGPISIQLSDNTLDFLLLLTTMWRFSINQVIAGKTSTANRFFLYYLGNYSNKDNALVRYMRLHWRTLLDQLTFTRESVPQHVTAAEYQNVVDYLQKVHPAIITEMTYWPGMASSYFNFPSVLPWISAGSAAVSAYVAYQYAAPNQPEQTNYFQLGGVAISTFLAGIAGVSSYYHHHDAVEQKRYNKERLQDMLRYTTRNALQKYADTVFADNSLLKLRLNNILERTPDFTVLADPNFPLLSTENNKKFLDKLHSVLYLSHCFKFILSSEQPDFTSFKLFKEKAAAPAVRSASAPITASTVADSAYPSTYASPPLIRKCLAPPAFKKLPSVVRPLPSVPVAFKPIHDLPQDIVLPPKRYHLVQEEFSGQRKAYFQIIANPVLPQRAHAKFARAFGEDGYKVLDEGLMEFKLLASGDRVIFRNNGKYHTTASAKVPLYDAIGYFQK